MNQYLLLPRDSNQALGIGKYAIDFLAGAFGEVDPEPLKRTEQFFVDSIGCAIAALGIKANAPLVLRQEAMYYPMQPPLGVPVLGSQSTVAAEKAVLADSSAARELDSNGTNFGYNPRTGSCRGEFGHNDFYPVCVAGAMQKGLDGAKLLRAMLCLDEIRGRLAEVFGLKDYKIDHVLHGGIASAAVYGALVGATAEQIESAIGQLVAHHVPFRAIRHGHQLSDSKGASAAITAEMAVTAVRRAMRGFIGPADIFRNPQAIFCLFEKPQQPGESPFDLPLSTTGNDFAIMGMHFKLGLYEHQSAGAIHGLIQLLAAHPALMDDPAAISNIRITIYEPAWSIIGDPHKRNPQTRQSADHSMVYIISTILRKACETKAASWSDLMLLPADYADDVLNHPVTRSLMERIEFVHGGPEYDSKYPDGIPTTIEITHNVLGNFSSGMVLYPDGHARGDAAQLSKILDEKFRRLASLGVANVDALLTRVSNLGSKSADQIRSLYDFELLT